MKRLLLIWSKKEYDEYLKYKLTSCRVRPTDTLIIPEGVVQYYSEVFIEGELVIEGDLKVV